MRDRTKLAIWQSLAICYLSLIANRILPILAIWQPLGTPLGNQAMT
jgi:hypothetical protein